MNIGKKIINLDSTSSTNDFAKSIALSENEGTIVTAENQISGKGRLGRNWDSPKGKGIYMSIILKPEIHPSKAARLTLIGAAAVNQALTELKIDSKIKWPNDIVINGKKVCGILTEMSCEQEHINYIVVGIGINVNLEEMDIPLDLRDKATSLRIVKNENIDKDYLLSLIINKFEQLYESFNVNLNLEETIKICRDKSAIIGKEIQIIENNQIRIGKAIDLNSNGELLVEFDKGIETIYSGEVSIRGLDNYI